MNINFFPLLGGISSYMRKQAGPSAKEIKNEKEMSKFISEVDPRIVGRL